jgi:hypothetical protein
MAIMTRRPPASPGGTAGLHASGAKQALARTAPARCGIAAALALVAVTSVGAGGAPAAAGPAFPAAAGAAAVTLVQWRGRGFGAFGLGLGLGILGAGIAYSEIYRPRPGYYYDDYAYAGPYYYPPNYQGDPRVICAQNFRSFEWNTGLYTTYAGEKRLCPYLR